MYTGTVGAAITVPDGAEIVVAGTNSITALNEDGYGIVAMGAVTYSGEGTLNVSAPKNTIYSVGATEFESGILTFRVRRLTLYMFLRL